MSVAAQGPRSDSDYSPRTSLRTLPSIGDQLPAPGDREIDFIIAAKAAADTGATAEEIATLPYFVDVHGFPQARYSPTKIQEWLDIPLDRLQALDSSQRTPFSNIIVSRRGIIDPRLRAVPKPSPLRVAAAGARAAADRAAATAAAAAEAAAAAAAEAAII